MEMMVERGIGVDHSTGYRWTVQYVLHQLEHFHLCKRAATGLSEEAGVITGQTIHVDGVASSGRVSF